MRRLYYALRGRSERAEARRYRETFGRGALTADRVRDLLEQGPLVP